MYNNVLNHKWYSSYTHSQCKMYIKYTTVEAIKSCIFTFKYLGINFSNNNSFKLQSTTRVRVYLRYIIFCGERPADNIILYTY